MNNLRLAKFINPKGSISPSVLLFSTIFVLTVFISWSLLAVRPRLFEAGLIPFFFEYRGMGQAIKMHFIFLIAFAIFAAFFQKTTKQHLSQKNPLQTFETHGLNIFLLSVLLLNNIILVIQTGPMLFSGNYFERMTSDEYRSAVFVLLPKILLSVFFFNLSNHSFQFIRKHIRTYGRMLIIAIGLDMLTAGRSLTFFALIYTMLLATKHLQNIWSTKRIVFTSILVFIGAYILGQIFNVVRWYGFDFSLNQLLLQFNSDAFNELRSYSTAIENLGQAYGSLTFGWSRFIADIISRILPGFMYSPFSINRLAYWNSSWKEHLQYIFYPGGQQQEGDVGIRVGLIGEIDLLLGPVALLIFAFIFAWALTKSRYRLIFGACAIYAIPYGVTSLYIPVMIIISIWSLKITGALLQSKFHTSLETIQGQR